MMLERTGFVGLFSKPLQRKQIEELALVWLETYGALEQTVGGGSQVLTHVIRSPADLTWEKDLQFRIVSGDQFVWIYLTQDRQVIETTGLAGSGGGDCLCRDVLENLPGCCEIINERNDRRLDELEAKGLM